MYLVMQNSRSLKEAFDFFFLAAKFVSFISIQTLRLTQCTWEACGLRALETHYNYHYYYIIIIIIFIIIIITIII